MYAATALQKAELSIVIVNDDKMQEINLVWRGKDKPTDVLSFPQLDRLALIELEEKSQSEDFPQWLLGDVIISVDTAHAQAKAKGHDFLQELKILLIHGVVHLLSYDHELNSSEAIKMEEIEKNLLDLV